MVDLLVQLPDLHFGAQVDHVVALRPLPVLRLLALLAHHDDRRLQRGKAGKRQIEKDEGIGIERVGEQPRHVDAHPRDEDDAGHDDEAPGASEGRHRVGCLLAQRPLSLQRHVGARLHRRGTCDEILDHTPVQLGKLAPLVVQQLFHIEPPVAGKVGFADQRLIADILHALGDERPKRRPQLLDLVQLLQGKLSPADRAAPHLGAIPAGFV